jgi:hypothetical protein
VTALLRKELRALAPLFLLMVLTNSGDVLYRPFTERLDEQAWLDISSYLLAGGDGLFAAVLMVFALLVAFSLFPREHDEGTIDFLHALPVSRATVFFAKMLAGWAVLAVTDGLLQSPNRQSFTGEQWRLDVAAAAAGLQIAVCTFVLCHGVFVSFFRRFGLIPYALAGWVVVSLGRASPAYAVLDFTNLLDLEYHGARVVVPWAALALHGAIAAAALGAGLALWTGRGEEVAAAFDRLRRATAGRAALGCATALAVAALLGLAVFAAGDPGEVAPPAEGGPRFRTGPTARVETARFVFTYPDGARDRAHAVIARADAHHERLRALLDAPAGAVVNVDLTEDSPFHEGITAWTTMRVGLFASDDPRRLERTFVHELAHAFQFQIARGRLGDEARATRFFGEGAAEYLSWELVPDPAARRGSRRTAVAAWRRHGLRFADLADDDRLRRRFDPALAYSLGETWTAALVEACGAGAIGAALRALGRDRAPRGLPPVDLWRDALREAGCGLEPVLSAWAALLDRTAAEEAEFLDALPRVGGAPVAVVGDALRVVAYLDRPPLPPDRFPNVTYFARVRGGPADDDGAIRAVVGRVVAGSDGRQIDFDLPRALLTGRRFQLQLGLRFAPEVWPWFENWQDADVP